MRTSLPNLVVTIVYVIFLKETVEGRTEFISSPGKLWVVEGTNINLTWRINHDVIPSEILTFDRIKETGKTEVMATMLYGDSTLQPSSIAELSSSGGIVYVTMSGITSSLEGQFSLSHNGTADKNAFLYILRETDAPVIHIGTMRPEVGDDYFMTCYWGKKDRGIPVRYAWLRDGSKDMPDNNVLSLSDRRLAIDPIRLEDSKAIYKCIVSGGQFVLESEPFSLSALRAPRIVHLLPETPIVINLGESITLVANFTADPNTLSYIWSHQGTRIQQGRDKNVLIQSGVLASTLKIKEMGVQDYGNYTCQAHHLSTNKSATGMYLIEHPGKPDKPQNLSIEHYNASMVAFQWTSGVNWDTPPSFSLQIDSPEKITVFQRGFTPTIINNNQESYEYSHQFALEPPLKLGMNYTLYLTVSNEFGEVTIKEFIYISPLRITTGKSGSSSSDTSRVVIIFGGIMGAVIFVGLVLLIAMRKKFTKPDEKKVPPIDDTKEVYASLSRNSTTMVGNNVYAGGQEAMNAPRAVHDSRCPLAVVENMYTDVPGGDDEERDSTPVPTAHKKQGDKDVKSAASEEEFGIDVIDNVLYDGAPQGQAQESMPDIIPDEEYATVPSNKLLRKSTENGNAPSKPPRSSGIKPDESPGSPVYSRISQDPLTGVIEVADVEV